MEKKKYVSVGLTEECYEKIKELAQENSYSIPGYICQLVRVHLRELERAKKNMKEKGRPCVAAPAIFRDWFKG